MEGGRLSQLRHTVSIHHINTVHTQLQLNQSICQSINQSINQTNTQDKHKKLKQTKPNKTKTCLFTLYDIQPGNRLGLWHSMLIKTVHKLGEY